MLAATINSELDALNASITDQVCPDCNICLALENPPTEDARLNTFLSGTYTVELHTG
jgi:hypothetical protein